MLYFAYCTLLDFNEMRKYCPSAKPTGVMQLEGFKLCFATYSLSPSEGGCSLEKAPGKIMYGVLYEVSDNEMEVLDKASGLDKGYWTRTHVTLLNHKKENIRAVTYVIPNPHGRYHPPKTYSRPILIGAKAFQLPLDYVAELERIIEYAEGS